RVVVAGARHPEKVHLEAGLRQDAHGAGSARATTRSAAHEQNAFAPSGAVLLGGARVPLRATLDEDGARMRSGSHLQERRAVDRTLRIARVENRAGRRPRAKAGSERGEGDGVLAVD